MSVSCAICAAVEEVGPVPLAATDEVLALCPLCAAGLGGDMTPGPRWRCLADAVWSGEAAVQIAAWRLLDALKAEGWAADLLAQVWLEPEVLALAQAGIGAEAKGIDHRDAHGAVLAQGDTVTLIKDLDVKGAGFTAKRGTAVRGIRLVPDNAAQIEGRVNGQQIVILCQYVKKS
ncbi:PhnA protein [Rhodobacter sp. HX-7-19]|uniref:PhnA protein n=1 Tax=Paragemmobacter kunshanensis TaxID=2583234 RepID=A0A6M1TQX3_9RHOB|nr:alkylphosphonate utilization protein [Rhodobacter kunshanensis]NGQ90260.1 PhnA protein [Rhodobacter kunshanensis]